MNLATVSVVRETWNSTHPSFPANAVLYADSPMPSICWPRFLGHTVSVCSFCIPLTHCTDSDCSGSWPIAVKDLHISKHSIQGNSINNQSVSPFRFQHPSASLPMNHGSMVVSSFLPGSLILKSWLLLLKIYLNQRSFKGMIKFLCRLSAPRILEVDFDALVSTP